MKHCINTKKYNVTNNVLHVLFIGFPYSAWSTPEPSRSPPVTRVSEKDNAWLLTLDPILVTIIVMSSLGVLLGAVCAGLLLYCTCSYNGISSRSSTTLENYNFELYDGIKQKVINQQRCCSEAWSLATTLSASLQLNHRLWMNLTFLPMAHLPLRADLWFANMIHRCSQWTVGKYQHISIECLSQKIMN